MTAAGVAPNEKCSEDRGAAFPTCGSGLARDSALHVAMRFIAGKPAPTKRDPQRRRSWVMPARYGPLSNLDLVPPAVAEAIAGGE